MGLAASQARLLSLTARIHDVEYQAQMIQSAKLQLALQEDEVYRKYNEALDATTLTFRTTGGDTVKATFNNLCGEGSITNGLAGSKNYIFRDGSNNVIVPSDIYDAYAKFNGNGDAYAFAMYMMTGQDDNLTAAYNQQLESYFTNNSDKGSDQLKSLRESIKNTLSSLFPLCTSYNNNSSLSDEQFADFMNDLLQNGFENFKNDEFNTENLSENDEKLFDNLKEQYEKYTHLMFRSGGAESIYNNLVGNDFDQDKFNYYLRWAKLLEFEDAYVNDGKVYGATKASDYGQGDIENNPELLNEMLQSGRITVDLIYVDNKTGKIGDEATSASSDSNLAYTNTSSIDKAALKKAEAEYEHAMKEIDKKDKRFDMDLNRLETERSALTTEYDSVKKVIQDNIERTFGIFS